MKILAVVVLYEPNISILHENLNAYVSHVEQTIAWDNSPYSYRRNEEFLKQEYPSIIYMGDGRNYGISYVLNKAWEYARENNHEVLLTMDQDSVFVDFTTYRKRVEDYWKTEGLCVCGPTPNLNKSLSISQEFSRKNYVITSGMLIPISLLNVCGGYELDFKVDGIDVELCYHLKERGFYTYVDNRSDLVQRYGEQKVKKLLGRTFLCANYNASRLYGIFRNHIIIWRKYNHPKEIKRMVIHDYFVSFVIKDVLLFGNNKIKKLWAVFKGIRDGFLSEI